MRHVFPPSPPSTANHNRVPPVANSKPPKPPANLTSIIPFTTYQPFMASRYGPRTDNQHNPLFASSPYASHDRYLNTNSTTSNPYGSGGAYARTASTSPAPGAYRTATPNRKGQYSANVLEELESQNEAQVEGLSAKVRMLKDITTAIGDEVRSSTTLMETMNDSFESTRRRLKGTMGAMMRMASRTGVGWRAWVAFFAAVVVLFWWVWI
ncbi:hypothetical protein EDC01DRAFT_656671 [Geopyxis carbonaria]|nr:hypothetical protein EDC01DRAFT_656671 [Geopyxis carbonaria]